MTSEMTILFADVAGSVALHEKLGDYEAHRIVVKCLELMSDTVTECDGKVVEIIGEAAGTVSAVALTYDGVEHVLTRDVTLQIGRTSDAVYRSNPTRYPAHM